jgi:hypothetical protein
MTDPTPTPPVGGAGQVPAFSDSPPEQDGTEPMTEAEHVLCQKLGQCATEYVQVLIAATTTRHGRPASEYRELSDQHKHDVVEFVAHIHDLQHAVMARAAIRCYPERYRS